MTLNEKSYLGDDGPMLVVSRNMGGGSPRGMSFFMAAGECPRRAYLNRNSPGSGQLVPGTGASIGTIIHAFMELYYSFGKVPYAVEIDDFELQSDLTEANRIFDGYRERFPADEWDVLAVEFEIPANEQEANKILQAVGCEVTARIDLIVNIRPEHIPNLLYRRPELEGIRPGKWLVDHKSMSSRHSDAPIRYRYSPQFLMYMYLYNLLNPDAPVLGIIANNLVRHKKLVSISFFSNMIEYDGRDFDIQNVKEYVKNLSDELTNMKSLGSGRPNLSACVTHTSVCNHLLSGICNRRVG